VDGMDSNLNFGACVLWFYDLALKDSNSFHFPILRISPNVHVFFLWIFFVGRVWVVEDAR